MQTTADITADALRINVADLNEVITKIRRLHLAGKNAPKASARYLQYVRKCHELREAGIAKAAKGPLFDLMDPIPYRDQLVGYSAEQRKALEWKGVADGFPFSASVPFHYSIAAE
ncbi:hypothetical protein [Pseudorhizobium marinum]|uniref:hypothetical protein n=1 Tax=Pseudorhizobium marinum TaxID=1496690 RepID=UPI0004980DA5|nr:hypothetical protein [Pseudorhizobium marinum]